MEKEKKSSQIIVRMTEKEKEFLIEKAEEENRTISAIVKIALEEKYEKFGEKRKEVSKICKNCKDRDCSSCVFTSNFDSDYQSHFEQEEEK